MKNFEILQQIDIYFYVYCFLEFRSFFENYNILFYIFLCFIKNKNKQNQFAKI